MKADTDGDGLADGVETNTSTYTGPANTGTNPNNPDTDGDGMGDGAEVLAGRNPVDPSDGRTGLDVALAAYWTFDGTLDDIAHSASLGESTVADNGTFSGAPDAAFAATGFLGSGALELNGGAGWVTVPKSADTIGNVSTRNVSISLWLKANSFDVDWQAAISHGEGNHWRIARGSNSNPATMSYAGGTGDIYSSTVFEELPTEWFHLAAVTEQGVGTTLYINGVAEATGGAPTLDVALAAASDLHIGANPQAGGREWNGMIDDVAIWGRALTEAEVVSIHEAGAQGKSIASMLGAAPATPISVTDARYDAQTKQVTLTWTSTPGTNYGIHYSANVTDWSGVAVETVPAAAGAATTHSFPVPAAAANSPRLFFRVRSK